mmetsp:Transcript_36922/g.117483  ORF Transcript_36922/g.117483 Transcript_36922/m.117483 type:complete len:541 (-) Transcript_36922:149-1771(-)
MAVFVTGAWQPAAGINSATASSFPAESAQSLVEKHILRKLGSCHPAASSLSQRGRQPVARSPLPSIRLGGLHILAWGASIALHASRGRLQRQRDSCRQGYCRLGLARMLAPPRIAALQVALATTRGANCACSARGGGEARGQGPKEGQAQPQMKEPRAEIASGPAPVFDSAAIAQEEVERGAKGRKQKQRASTVDWENPGINVLERARKAAEEGWQEERWQQLQGTVGMDEYANLLPRSFLARQKRTQAPASIKDHIELHQLGRRVLRRWPRGEQRPRPFSGSDPAHNGMLDSVDDGKTSSMGRLAVAVHKGFLRHRASSHPAGLRGQPGVFPLAERPEAAFIGCSNVGKSSLLNAMTRTMQLAEARHDPGVTRSIDWYKCSRLPIDIIDLPGYGFAKGADYGNLLADFVATRKALRAIYILLDARTGLRPRDWEWLQVMGDMGPERIFVLTKTDLVIPKILAKTAKIVLEDIRCVPRTRQRLIMVSARLGNGMHDLRYHIATRAVAWAQQAQERAERIAREERAAKEALQAPRDELTVV